MEFLQPLIDATSPIEKNQSETKSSLQSLQIQDKNHQILNFETSIVKEQTSQFKGISSMKTSILILINTSLGAGIVSLPYVFKVFGIYIGVIIFIVAWFFTSFNCQLLLKAKNIVKIYDLTLLAKKSYGNFGEKIVQLTLFLSLYLVVASLFNIFQTNIQKILMGFFTNPDNYFFNSSTCLIIFAIIYLPFVLSKSISFLRYSSIIFVFALIVYLIIVIYNCFQKYFLSKQHQYLNYNLNFFPNPKFLTLKQIALAYPIPILAFTFQQNFFTVYKEMKHRTDAKIMKATYISQIIVLAIYLMLSILIYSTFCDDVQDNSLKNFNIADIGQCLYLILYISYSLVCMGSIPVLFFECRNTLFKFVKEIIVNYKFSKNNQQYITSEEKNQLIQNLEIPKFTFYSLTILQYSSIVTIALTCKNILVIFGFICAFGGTTITYIYPAAIYLKLTLLKKKNIIYWYAALTLIFGFLSQILAFIGAFLNI